MESLYRHLLGLLMRDVIVRLKLFADRVHLPASLVYTQYRNFIIQAFKCIAFRERLQKRAEARSNGDYGP